MLKFLKKLFLKSKKQTVELVNVVDWYEEVIFDTKSEDFIRYCKKTVPDFSIKMEKESSFWANLYTDFGEEKEPWYFKKEQNNKIGAETKDVGFVDYYFKDAPIDSINAFEDFAKKAGFITSGEQTLASELQWNNLWKDFFLEVKKKEDLEEAKKAKKNLKKKPKK